jgi:hypothetical protein
VDWSIDIEVPCGDEISDVQNMDCRYGHNIYFVIFYFYT